MATKKRETVIHEKIIDWIHANCPNSKVMKRHGSPMGERGNPDVTGCIQGHHIEIEVKKRGGAVDPLQAKRLREWADAGAIVGVAETVGDVSDILRGSGKLVFHGI